MREFRTLKELKDTHQKEVNEFPFIYVFAFGEKEFVKKMAEEIKKRKPNCTGITTMEGIAKHIASIGAGAYIFKEDSTAMREMFERHETERKHFNKTEKNLVATILYEMNNHEYGYTRDPYDTLQALGKSMKDLETDKKFARCWAKAQKTVFDWDDENN